MAVVPVPLSSQLQWGRNLFVAESLRASASWSRIMSSLQWGRNLFVAERPPRHGRGLPVPAASMGPQLVRCGKQGDIRDLVLGFFASMGPQLVRCGKPVALFSITTSACASMGPQLVRCGKCGRTSSSIPCLWASMGPQLVRCGKFSASWENRWSKSRLQWGRNLFVAERGIPTHLTGRAAGLQWGRNLFVAESCPAM